MKVKSKVTIGAMKVLEKYHLTVRDDKELTKNLLAVYTKEEAVLEIARAIFEEMEFNTCLNFEEFDLSEITEGIGDFLRRLLQPQRS